MWVFPGKEIWHIIQSVIESMIYKGSCSSPKLQPLYNQDLNHDYLISDSYSMIGEYLDTIFDITQKITTA